MPVVNHRNAAFSGVGSTHQHIPLALAAGWILETVQVQIAFQAFTTNPSTWQDWIDSRVGWGLWFGPSSTPTLNWSTDRSSVNMAHWTAAPWVMRQMYFEETSGVTTGVAWFQAGLVDGHLEVPVYREAAGQEYQIRTIDVISSLGSFFTYTSQVAISARIAQP